MNAHRWIIVLLSGTILASVGQAQTLVPGDPPLTQDTFDKHVAYFEFLFNMKVTVAQRMEYQERIIAVFKRVSKAQQEGFIKKTESAGVLATFSPGAGAAVRLIDGAATLKRLRASKAEDSQWWVAAYDAAHKPGSAQNPVLAEGNPPLTQDMVREYCDFMDWHLDRSRGSAWPSDAVQQLITSDWSKVNTAGRDAFVDDIKWWKESFPKLKFEERKDARQKRPSAYRQHVTLTAADGAERQRWVDGINAPEVKAKILLAGDPPLTQEMLDRDIDHSELLLDIRLTPAQRQRAEQLRLDDLKSAGKAWKDTYVKAHQLFRAGIPGLSDAARVKIRDDNQLRHLAMMRALLTDEFFRFLLPIYESRLVAPGDPPLTRGDFDKHVAILEANLDIRLTMAQRREYLALKSEEWKKTTKAIRETDIKFIRTYHGDLAGYSSAILAMGRVGYQTSYLKTIRASSIKSSRWLVATYDAARKPGSARNPILAAGDPPLTQDMVNRYADYLEYMIDRTRTGGWSHERFEAMQRLITADWQQKDGAGKAAFLADVNWWKETFPKLSADQRDEAKTTKLSAYRAHVEKTVAAGEERRRWIAGIAEDDRLEVELLQKKIIASEQMKRDAMLRAQIEQSRHETQMFIISKIAGNAPTPGYGYGYFLNPRTYQQEFRFGWK